MTTITHTPLARSVTNSYTEPYCSPVSLPNVPGTEPTTERMAATGRTIRAPQRPLSRYQIVKAACLEVMRDGLE